jgi:hypothetical protein
LFAFSYEPESEVDASLGKKKFNFLENTFSDHVLDPLPSLSAIVLLLLPRGLLSLFLHSRCVIKLLYPMKSGSIPFLSASAGKKKKRAKAGESAVKEEEKKNRMRMESERVSGGKRILMDLPGGRRRRGITSDLCMSMSMCAPAISPLSLCVYA